MRWFDLAVLGWCFCGAILPRVEGADSADVIRFDCEAVWKASRPQGGTGDGSWASDTLPIGNGRMGAMIYGGAQTDRLELNEISLWSGSSESDVGDKSKHKGPDSLTFGSYQPFGTLTVSYRGHEEVKDYCRGLSLEEAVAYVSCEAGGAKVRREYFASFPDQVMVMEASASGSFGRGISADFEVASLHPQDRFSVSVDRDGTGWIRQSGTLKNGLRYEGVYALTCKGGTIAAEGNRLVLKGAKSYRLLMSLGTDYALNADCGWRGEAPSRLVERRVKDALAKSADELRKRHVDNYRSLYGRVVLDLGVSDSSVRQLPLDKRLAAYGKAVDGKVSPRDPELEAALFQFGRYLLISSSRPGSLPANLQGLWNYSLIPPWDSDYHNNINVQMCYWPAETTNLSECSQSLMEFIRETAKVAGPITRKHFKAIGGGPVRGWTARTAQNAFGGQGFSWNTPASAWYALHLWEHYRFTQDRDFLAREAYPLMKEICHFWEDSLKELDAGGANFQTEYKDVPREKMLEQLKRLPKGTLVAPLGWSPEQQPERREDGVAHDQQIVWELFSNAAQAADVLGMDSDWARELRRKRDLLAKPVVNGKGRLQEWMIDREGNPGHRHTSHLFAVYPGCWISAEKTPEWAEAARLSLIDRGTAGDARRSWTWAWRANLWARLREGDRAYAMVQGLLRHNIMKSMFATHPPMQIDGNLGIAAGMAEMLVQSHADTVELLPALPSAWKDGSVKGLKARGNITVDVDWKDGRVTGYRLTSPSVRSARVRVNGRTETVAVHKP